MSEQPIHALVSDLDDTLLNREHRFGSRTLEALLRIQRQGIRLVLASGRCAASMRPYVIQTGTKLPYIACNGAQIVDAVTHEVLVSHEIPVPLAREVLAFFEKEGVYAQIYLGDDWYYRDTHPFADEYSRSSGVVGTKVGRLYDFIDQPTPKILAIADPARIETLRQSAMAAFGDRLTLTISKPIFLEVSLPNANKGAAVATLAGMIGLDPETTLTAGDSLNDLTMLTWSTRALSFESAREEAQAVAWRLGKDAHNDAIADLLDALIPGTPSC